MLPFARHGYAALFVQFFPALCAYTDRLLRSGLSCFSVLALQRPRFYGYLCPNGLMLVVNDD